jgi:hypothetical protein
MSNSELLTTPVLSFAAFIQILLMRQYLASLLFYPVCGVILLMKRRGEENNTSN